MGGKLYQKEYYQKHKKEIKKKKRIYRQKPKEKEKISKYNKLYRTQNKEKIKEYFQRVDVKAQQKIYHQRPEVKARQKENYRKNKETIIRNCVICNKLFNLVSNQKVCSVECKEKRINQIRKKYNKEYNSRLEVITKRKEKMKDYYQSDKYKLTKRRYQKQRRNNDEGFAIEGKLRTLLYITLQKYSKNGKIMSSKKYGVDFKAIIESIGDKPNDGNIYEIDHIIPLSFFNHNNPQEIRWAWSPENLQWLRKEINRWKGNRFILGLTIQEQEKLIKKVLR